MKKSDPGKGRDQAGRREREALPWPGCGARRWVWEHAQGRVMTWRSGCFPSLPTTRPSTPVDGQPRMDLQYHEKSEFRWNPGLTGSIISVCLAVLAFGVIVAS